MSFDYQKIFNQFSQWQIISLGAGFLVISRVLEKTGQEQWEALMNFSKDLGELKFPLPEGDEWKQEETQTDPEFKHLQESFEGMMKEFEGPIKEKQFFSGGVQFFVDSSELLKWLKKQLVKEDES